MNNLFIMLAMLGFGASFWGTKAASRPGSAASRASSASSTTSGGSAASSASETETCTKDKCFSRTQKLVEKGIFATDEGIYIITSVKGDEFVKTDLMEFLGNVITNNRSADIRCSMMPSKNFAFNPGKTGSAGAGARTLETVLKAYLKDKGIEEGFAPLFDQMGLDADIAHNFSADYTGDKESITISFNPTTKKLTMLMPSYLNPES